MKVCLLLGLMAVAVSACASKGDGNMIGAPWQWPGAVIGSGVSNAIYTARRDRVAAHVGAHLEAISVEALAGGGRLIEEGARLAEVSLARKPELIAQLRDSHASFFDKPSRAEAVEAVTVAFMVHGG